MNLGSIAFALARTYGRHSPVPWRKWQICRKILGLGRIEPWKNTARWQRFIRNMPAEDVVIEGVRIRTDWHEGLGMLLMHQYEPYLCHVLKQIVGPGDVILDVGANIGFISLLFAVLTGPKGRVYSYEPVKRTLERFRANLERNKDLEKGEIVVREKGLSNSAGSATVFIPTSHSGTGFEIGQASVMADFNLDRSATTGRDLIEETIELTRLDDETFSGPIDIVKCDVEGAEKLFLEGARSTLRKDKPILIIEWNPGPQTYSVEDTVEIVQSLGDYAFFEIRHFGVSPKPLDKDAIAKGGELMLCAIRDRHADRLKGLVRSWQR